MKSAMGLTLLALAGFRQPEARRSTNPNPPGVIKDDSCTDQVLRFLRANPTRYLTHGQIVSGTGCKPKSVSWALFYLCDLRVIDARSRGGCRSPLYKEYRSNPPINELV